MQQAITSLLPPCDELTRKSLASPPQGISSAKRRQIKRIAALYEGRSEASIADDEEISVEAVRKLKKKLNRMGAKALIQELTTPSRARKSAAAGQRAGRPGYQDFDQWAAAQTSEDEPVFELATLLISSEVQIATIAIREGRKADFERTTTSDNERLDELFLRRLQVLNREFTNIANIPIFWTRVLMVDTLLSEIFRWLRKFSNRISERSQEDDIPVVTPLKDRFGARFSHLILSNGPEDACRAVYMRLGAEVPVVHLRADKKVGFLRHLEAILHHRRLTKSCLGFLPGASALYDLVKGVSSAQTSKTLAYEISERSLGDIIKDQMLAQDYFLARGILVNMNGYLWSKIAYQEDIKFRTLTRVPEIVVDQVVVPGCIRILIRPMPGIEYSRLVPWNGSSQAFEKHVRKVFRSNSATRQFTYSTTSASGKLRSSIVISEDFLAQKSRKKPTQVGVTLFPRHFLLSEPVVQLEKLAELIRDKGATKKGSGTPLDDNLQVLHVPYLVSRLRQALEKVNIWDRLASAEKWQDDLTEIGIDAKRSSGKPYELIFLKMRPKAVLEKDEWDEFMHLIPFGATETDVVEIVHQAALNTDVHLSAEAYGGHVEKAIQQKFQEAMTNPATMLEAFKSHPKETLNQSVQGLLAIESFLAAGPVRAHLAKGTSRNTGEPLPNPSAASELLSQLRPVILNNLMSSRSRSPRDEEQDFKNILMQLDADYLLRTLDLGTRKQLDKDAARWAKRCEEVIAAEYWIHNRINLPRIAALVRPQFLPLVDQHRDELESICGTLRARFNGDKRFAIRAVMETMQRCALAGLPPLPIAVASHSSILARWRALVRGTINRRLAGLASAGSRTVPIDQVEDRYVEDSPFASPYAAENADEDVIVGEIRVVISRVLAGDLADPVLSEFQELSLDENKHTWDHALCDFGDLRKPTATIQLVRDAVNFCLSEGTRANDSGGFLTKLRKLLFRARPPVTRP